jgi:hypothetical protein
MSDVGLIYGVGRREARVIAVVEVDHGFRGSIPGPYLYLPWLPTPWSYDSLIHCPAPVISARRTWT